MLTRYLDHPKIIPVLVICALGGILALLTVRAIPISSGGSGMPPAPAGSLSSLTSTDKAIAIYQRKIADDPRNTESLNALATAYLRKARESADPAYTLRAEQALLQALALNPDDYGALQRLAWVYTVKHEFKRAKDLGQRLARLQPDDWRTYGILGDAHIELGEYREAVSAFQRMVDLRPGLASYSRASYVRELHGDVDGAIRLMEMAVQAGSRRDAEGLAWTLVQLATLHLGRGGSATAERYYKAAIDVFADYPYALAGLGHVRAAQGKFAEAIQFYQRSLARVPLPEVAAALGDVYVRVGRREEAERQFALVEHIGRVTQLNMIVYNRELAYFLADHDRHLEQAVSLAERETEVRGDIYTTDTLAWAYFKAGRLEEADRAMRQALALGTRDARLFYHAGMIAYRRGDAVRAKRYLNEALGVNPSFHVLHAGAARRILEELGQ